MTLRTHASSRTVLVIAVAGALALAGCSGGSKAPAAGGSTSTQPSVTAPPPSWVSPLTGVKTDGNAPKRPIMIVKIDNSIDSAPQIGLHGADLVTEELVEGGITRLAVFYYSKLPKVVGPVRSMRATDIGVVEPAHAVLVASGGAPPTVRRIARAHIKTFTEGAVGYYRDDSRAAPYNLFMHIRALAKTLKPPKQRLTPYLPWGSANGLPRGRKAVGLSATFSGGHTTQWSYRGGHYVNTNSNGAHGDRYFPDTVLVLRVHVGNAGYLDPAGNPVPETDFTGTGAAIVFHAGRMLHATWDKHGFHRALTLKTAAGPLGLPPGHVWVELVPANGGSVSVKH
ncbi:MAG: DUF3048 domain-containing protein [Nocardioidaceae bacterium]